ncbi:MAG TPA: response regulator [Kofleriaceae bacterium]|jgi:CheY-like chemotaxis protein
MTEPRRILVVDDDPSVLRVVTRMLRRMGFEVVSTTRPVEALERVLDPRAAFACILTDVDMPELRGTELLRSVAAAGIELPAILMSGRLDDGSVGRQLLEKPFGDTELRRALAQAGIAIDQKKS